MGDEEMRQADAEYDALPGTEPDGWSFITEAELGETPDDRHDAIRETVQLWRDNGRTFFRVTDWTGEYQPAGCEAGVWVEAWKVQPRKMAGFNPPLTANPREGSETS